MSEQIEPTTEWDVRIAEAMGWRVPSCGDPSRLCWHAHSPRGEWDLIPCFTTDPALIIPMLDRIVELTRAEVQLIRRETANLAVAAVLLAVWEEVRPK